MSIAISNSQDVIEAAHVCVRLAELSAALFMMDRINYDEACDELRAEIKLLKQLQADVSAVIFGEWDSQSLVRHDHFTDFIRSEAEKELDMDRWPLMFVDWERAANERRIDWHPLEFDGVPYWIR
jgi:hypothetical protein